MLLPPAIRIEFMAAQSKLALAGASISAAVEFYLKHHASVSDILLKDAVARCVTAKKLAGSRERSIRQLTHTLSKFESAHGGKRVAEIGANDIERWLNGNDWATATRRSHLADVKTLFSFCLKRRFIPLNPCGQIDNIKLEDKAPGILTVDECRRLMESAQKNDPGLVPYITLGLFCGIRPAEIEQLSWADVGMASGQVGIEGHKAKSGKRRFVTISDNGKAWLARGGDLPAINIVKRLRRVRKAAGIPWPHDCMRHSFASYHLAKHGSQDSTSHELGHGSTQMLFQNYRQRVEKADAEAFFQIMPKPEAK